MATPAQQTGSPSAPKVNPAVVAGAQAAAAGQKETTKPAKAPREAENVKMKDGRTVEFVGKRKMLKETIIEQLLIKIGADGSVTIPKGAVKVRIDLRNGTTKTYTLPASLIAKFAGHGGEQKYGDELASPAEKPLSFDDMEVALDELDAQLQKGEWRAPSEGGGGVAGASIVLRAIVEASEAAGKPRTLDQVKEFINKRLEAAKAKGEKLSRKDLYDSFRAPATKTGQIIARMEKEELAKNVKVDANAEMNALMS